MSMEAGVFAYSYPLLGAFWTMFMIFIWIIWIFILFRVIIDIFRSHDMGGGMKALWLLFVIILPFLGVFVYLIARGHKMAEHDLDQAKANDQAFKAYVQDAAGSTSSADELAKLADLKAKGVLTEDEFNQQKAKLLA